VLAVLAAGMLLGSGTPRAASGGTAAGPRFIAAAPPGTIVFSSTRHAPRSSGAAQPAFADFELYVVRPDGTRLTQITKGRGAIIGARWSPDGKTLAFIWALDATHSQLWTATAKGKRLKMLFDFESVQVGPPRWSPDGTQLAYIDDNSIRMLDVFTGSDRLLVEGSWPAWSNVGGSSVVVYTSGRFVGEGSQTSLRVIEPDGANDRPIVFGSGDPALDLENASEASAAPTSARIAFVTSANNYQGESSQWNEQIYVAELIDGNPVRSTAPRLVSDSPTNDHWPPAWPQQSSSTDAGSCIVWTTDGKQFGRGHLVLTSIRENDTKNFDLTTASRGYDFFPDWHPDAVCPTSIAGRSTGLVTVP
jgi:dipeptidyl aminopeptidase/acylaminoacyl peptidase